MLKKTVLLYHPRFEKSGESKERRFPLSLLALAGPLVKEGYTVKIIDAIVDDDAQEKVLESLDDAICVGFMVWTGFTITDSLELSKKIKKVNPKIPTVWGGWHPSLLPLETIKNPFVDIVVRGQGEITFCELVQQLEKNHPLKEVLGITYKSDNRIITNPDRPLVPLDDLPPLPYHLIDFERYVNAVPGLGKRTALYVSSHGCPYNCSFCADVMVWKRRRYDCSAERVLEDLKKFIEDYKIDGVMFWDNNFFVNINKVKKICEGIIKNKWNIKWGGLERVDHFISLDEETIKLIKKSGCNLIVPGVESGSQKILDFLNKGFKVEDIIKFSEVCQKHDIRIGFDFMVGLPNETEEDFNKTLDLIKRVYPLHKGNVVTISFYIPYPGTRLYEEVIEKYGFKPPKSLEGWSNYDCTMEMAWVNKAYKEKLNMFLFYLQFAFLNEHFKKKIEMSKFKSLIWPMHKIALFRVKTNFFKLPIERKMYDFLKKIL